MSGKSWSAGVCLGAALCRDWAEVKCGGKLESLRDQPVLGRAIELHEV